MELSGHVPSISSSPLPPKQGSGQAGQPIQLLTGGQTMEPSGHVPSVSSSPLPPRLGSGQAGQPIQLVANHYPLHLCGGLIYHYNVDITPKTTNRQLNRQVTQFLEKEHAEKLVGYKLVYDGRKTLYTVRPLPFSQIEISAKIALDGDIREREFLVHIKYAAKVNLDVLKDMRSKMEPLAVQTAIQAIDIIVSQTPSMKFESVGRSYFPTHGHTEWLGEENELRFGYYQSACPTMWSMVIKIDVSATGFYKEQLVLELLKAILPAHRVPHSLKDPDRLVFAKQMIGLRIQVTHLPYPRKYRVVGVTRQSADRQRFTLDDGQTLTVQNYFERKYK